MGGLSATRGGSPVVCAFVELKVRWAPKGPNSLPALSCFCFVVPGRTIPMAITRPENVMTSSAPLAATSATATAVAAATVLIVIVVVAAVVLVSVGRRFLLANTGMCQRCNVLDWRDANAEP